MSSTLSPNLIQKLSLGKVKPGKAVESSFGTSNTTLPLTESTGTNSAIIDNDFFYITVRDSNGTNLLTNKITVEPESIETIGDGSVIINIGKHLRNIGLESGVFNVEYDFLRRKAGIFGSQLIDSTGELYFGPTFVVEGQLYKGTYTDTTELSDSIKLGEVEGGLTITGISPSRTEIYVGRESKILNTTYVEESETYFNPTYVYFFTATNSTYTGNWGLPYVSKHPFINAAALDKYRMGGITSGQIAHGSDVMSLTKANKVIERERFDKVYQPGTTRLILKDFFVTAIEEVHVTKPKTNTDIESRPMESPIGANGPNNSTFTGTLSTKEQWVYDGTEDTWVPNLEVIQTDEDGNYNFNELVDGVPLDIALKKKLIPWPFEDTSAFWDEGSGGATFNTNSFYNTIRRWFYANRDIVNKFTNIQGDTFNWDEYGIFDATAGSVTEDVIFQFLADFDNIISGGGYPVSTQNLKNDIRRYFYLQDRNNLAKLVSRTELETVFEEQKIYADFIADIVDVKYDGDYVDNVVLKYSPKEFAEKAGIYLEESPNDTTLYTGKLMFFDVGNSPVSKLSTYLYTVDGIRNLICNSRSGGSEGVFKLANPLSDEISVGTEVNIVEEILPTRAYGVELVPWLEAPVPTTVLLPPDQESAGDVIQPFTTEYKSWAELSFQSSSLYRDIINKVISGSLNETELNIDYSDYDNFVHFSSAEKRLRNFKYKLDLLEGYEQESSSIAGLYTGSGALGNDPNTVVTGSQQKLDSLELKIDELKNNFDGYEKYLYHESASYTTSSFGIHYDATWPKQNTSKPYVLYNTSQSIASTWFDNQIVSASDYDVVNKDYLIYHLPEYIKSDSEHRVFLRLVKMLGQHFDNIKNYIDEFGTIHDRQEALTKGLPKQLTSTIAESMGWKVASGWDLVEIDEYATGKKVAQDNTITSSSAVPYQDISKEIWSRILTNMPLFLKARGTLKALKGLVTCYGIPSTILRVREYGGPIKHEVNPDYEAVRRFSKALDFKQAQYVHTKWSGSADTGMKPKTVEFRFKAVSSSNMNLVQMNRGGESADIKHGQGYGGSNYTFTHGFTGGEPDRPAGWAVWLKDNGSVDNMASIVFSISGSNQSGSMPTGEYKEVTSSALPFFNGDYWSVMLRKELVNAEIFSTRIHSGSVGMVTGSHNFETGSLQTPFESVGSGGTLEVISQSSYVFDGSYSLGFKNTKSSGEAYTYPYTNNDDGTNVSTYGDARVASASFAEEFDFSVYARSKTGGAKMQMWIMELGEKGNILEESYTYYPSYTKNWGYGALHPAMYGIGTKWEKYTVRAKISHPQTKFIGVRLDNETNGQTIYFDKGELRQVGTDSLKFDIIAKQFDSGRDVIQYQTRESLIIDGLSNAASASYTGSWEQDGNLFIGGTTMYQNYYGGFVSGSTLSQHSSSFSGSMMEFRLWSTPLDEQHFDTHVENPKSFVGNNFTGSVNELVQRLSFNEDTNHGTGADSEKSIRNTSANSNYPYTGSAKGFADENNYSNVVDRLKLKLPKIGGIRRSANKERISPRQLKDEFKGSLNLSTKYRVEKSVGSIDTKDSERLGVYFSPVDVINEDIVSSLSDLDLEDKLGDPRDDFRLTYDKFGGLKQTADIYWQKYKGSNNFWDYLRLINYYDHSIFSQVKKLIPARAKATVGVLIENNILERNKIRRETPFREYPVFEDTLSKLRSSGSDYFELSGENQVWENSASYANIFRSGSHFAELASFNDFVERDVNYKGSVMNFGKTYQNWGAQYSGSYTTIGVSSVFTESIAMIFEQRTSKYNQKPIFIYDTPEHFYQSSASSVSFQSSSYENQADDAIGLERAFFLGTQNTKETALPSKDLSGQITYDAVTSVLTNPYVTVTQTSPNVKLTTELDTGADQLDIKEDD